MKKFFTVLLAIPLMIVAGLSVAMVSDANTVNEFNEQQAVTQNDDITKFELTTTGINSDGTLVAGNQVTFNIEYEENGYWYWDQEDYEIPEWHQTVYEVNEEWVSNPTGQWVWDGTEVPNETPNINDIDGDGLSNAGDWDDPNMVDNDADGDGITNENDPDDDNDGINDWEWIDDDDDPDTPKVKVKLDQEWTDTIEEPIQPQPAPPSPGYNGYYLEQPGGPEETYALDKWVITNGSDTYYLDQTYNHYNWEFNPGSGTWQDYVAPEWGYTEEGYWPAVTQQLDEGRNKSVWVDYELTSNGYMVEEGTVDIERGMQTGNETLPNPQDPTEPWYDPFNPTEPTWNQSELDGEQYDTSYSDGDGDFKGIGTNQITFGPDVLHPGFTYQFEYSLKYETPTGEVKEYDSGNYEFKVAKQGPSINMYQVQPVQNESAQVKVEITDPYATRVSDVEWTLKDKDGTLIDSGSFDSNTQVLTFNGLDMRQEKYTFEITFDYQTVMGETPVTMTDSIQLGLDELHEDEIVIESNAIALENEILVNVYVDSEFEDWYDYYTGAYISIDGVMHDVELKEGSNQFTFTFETVLPRDIPIEIGVEYNDGEDKTSVYYYEIKQDSNVYLEMVPLLETIDITNTTATIGYRVEDISNVTSPRSSNFAYAEWRIKEEGGTYGEWTRVTEETGEIYLTDLKPDTTYEIEFQVATTENQIIHGMPFKFTTESSTTIEDKNIDWSTTSFWYTFEADNVDNWDEQVMYWDLTNTDTGMVEQTGQEVIDENGFYSISLYHLQAGTNYEFDYKYTIDGVTTEHTYQFMTDPYQVQLGVGYIWQDENSTITDGSMTLNYIGTIRSIELSYDAQNWDKVEAANVEFNTAEDGSQTITINSSLIDTTKDNIYIRINGATVVSIQINSLEPIAEVSPPEAPGSDAWWIILTIVLGGLVIIATSTGFYLWYRNDKNFNGIWSNIDLSNRKNIK